MKHQDVWLSPNVLFAHDTRHLSGVLLEGTSFVVGSSGGPSLVRVLAFLLGVLALWVVLKGQWLVALVAINVRLVYSPRNTGGRGEWRQSGGGLYTARMSLPR